MWKLLSGPQSRTHALLVSLNECQGRQIWVYDEEAGTPEERAAVEDLRSKYKQKRHQLKHSADELLRLQCSSVQPVRISKTVDCPFPSSLEGVTDAIRQAASFYATLQQEDGHWPGDYGGPMFLLPGLVFTCYVTGTLDTVLSPKHKEEMVRYLLNHQNLDGGFGLHIEGHSTMFGTGLSYVALRILGLSPEHPECVTARDWIQSRGGATFITSWGKFWLAVLGVYSWDGMNPLPPEIWLLPYASWTGIGLAHPGRFWCHCRMVYLPMSYIYGKRATGQQTKLVEALREELYPIAYNRIDWNKARNECAKEDLYYPHPLLQDMLWWALYQAEGVLDGSSLRKKALDEVIKHIHYEDENTRYVCIGPVNKVINMLCCWVEDPDSQAFKKHIPRLYDFLWMAEDGMKMQGYNGSQLWDTAFAVQALTSTGMALEFADCLKKAHSYVDASQVLDDAPGPLSKWYRHISKGAWPFSTRDHGWPISDCSSEGVKASLALRSLPVELVGEHIPDERIFDSINVILSYQNADGGWATYENTRSYSALELINPAETFGDIVVDYSYVECTSACMTALTGFRRVFPSHRAGEIDAALTGGLKYVLRTQRKDGSWYGSWGVCFTYGTWFGCDALAAVGHFAGESLAQDRACAFLLSKQNADGGWGESYLSCQDKVYTQLEDGASNVVQTAWALLALMAARYHLIDIKPIEAGVKVLLKYQEACGDWPQQQITGVFNRNCMITYANYRNIFPIWALGMYRTAVLQGIHPH